MSRLGDDYGELTLIVKLGGDRRHLGRLQVPDLAVGEACEHGGNLGVQTLAGLLHVTGEVDADAQDLGRVRHSREELHLGLC